MKVDQEENHIVNKTRFCVIIYFSVNTNYVH